ncbi:hypothetical protein DIT71_15445 [Marinobacter vulgaris]|uniref:MSHA biogenesis protein MshP n=1 Tax=Marinobacter vulgaris TaxID=1928331 RepID=A0A2V3ZHM3_9GAMM|nr:pilus assembly PilX N-terminal domain-containing protein [Marinobacter vulgaris]PXX89294.1 hypothetical protein DIT71_15445 [Marinobacter vulgaris]TSJ68143.1 hypothetical protein FPC41_15740 [Marinobacter vulgaris]
MYLERSPRWQTGAGLPIAIFIITVLSLIVLSMSQLQESSGSAISLQIQSQRAFFAAESGTQVAIADLLKKEADGNPINCPASFEEIYSNTFGASGLSGCNVDVECKGGDGVVTIKSMGVCGKESPEEARRTIEVRLKNDT